MAALGEVGGSSVVQIGVYKSLFRWEKGLLEFNRKTAEVGESQRRDCGTML